MVSQEEIKLLRQDIINFIYDAKKDDGSFDTMYLQPHYQPGKGWMNYPITTNLCIASIALNLLCEKDDPKISEILPDTCQYILHHSFRRKVWNFGHIELKYRVHNDTDTTALSSFFLSKMGYKINNSDILLKQKNDNGYFNLWIQNKYSRNYSLTDYYSLLRYNKLAQKCCHFVDKLIDLDDHELIVDCNNLLYLGIKGNEDIIYGITESLIKKNIGTTYYLSEPQVLFHICRLHFYQVIDINTYPALRDEVYNRLDSLIASNVECKDLLDYLYISIAILYLDNRFLLQKMDHASFIGKTISEQLYKTIVPFYTSNNKTDINPLTLDPSTYFGSPVYTASLYLEFVNLVRIPYEV